MTELAEGKRTEILVIAPELLGESLATQLTSAEKGIEVIAQVGERLRAMAD